MTSEKLTPEQARIINEFFEGGLPSVDFGMGGSVVFEEDVERRNFRDLAAREYCSDAERMKYLEIADLYRCK